MAPRPGGPDRSFADHVAACALDEFESQAVFRALLDAFARPGTVTCLPSSVVDRVPPALAPVLALADVDVTVAVVEHPVDDDRSAAEPRWGRIVAAATGARTSAVESAAMVVAIAPPAPEVLRHLMRGSAAAPEQGTRLTIACRALLTDDDLVAPDDRGTVAAAQVRSSVLLSGPGVDGSARVTALGIERAVFETIAAANDTFPAGVDTWLVADDGRVVGIPRSSTIEISGGR